MGFLSIIVFRKGFTVGARITGESIQSTVGIKILNVSPCCPNPMDLSSESPKSGTSGAQGLVKAQKGAAYAQGL